MPETETPGVDPPAQPIDDRPMKRIAIVFATLLGLLWLAAWLLWHIREAVDRPILTLIVLAVVLEAVWSHKRR